MAGPRNRFTADGSTNTFQFSFDDELSQVSTVRVQLFESINDVDGTTLVEGVGFTVNTTTNIVTLTDTPSAGTVVAISRFTLRDRQINWPNGGTLNRNDMNEDPNRLTAVTQEIEGDLDDCLRLNAAGTAWNAEGLEGTNAAPATTSSSWITYAQAEAILAGGNVTSLPEAIPIVWYADGVSLYFAITGFRTPSAYQMFVYVEGVVQSLEPGNEAYTVVTEDDTGYPGAPSGPAYVKFAEAPVAGARIEIRVLAGHIIALFDDGAIDGDAIADDSIGIQHINVGTGLNPRFMVFDDQGDASVRPIVSTDIIDLNASIASLPVNTFAAASGNLDMGLNKILNLGSATSTLGAVNKSQMENYTDTRMRVQVKDIAALMPTVVSGSFTTIATFNFSPDEVVVSASFDGGTHDATYVVLLMGANARRVAGEEFADGSRAPDILFQRSSDDEESTSFQMRIVAVNSLAAWSQGRALAKKYGDA